MKGVFYRGNMSNERVYHCRFSNVYKSDDIRRKRKYKPVEQLDAFINGSQNLTVIN